ncbi:MAG: alpha/beta hydrolase [Myxococcota bacterium]
MHLESEDGTQLEATHYPGPQAGWVFIGSATGVPQRFYAPMARWLVENVGVNVLTLDYRGVGASRPETLRGYPATKRDWARDFAAGVAYAAERGPTVVVGHSFCGHAFGMTTAHRKTRGCYVFAGGAGWHGWMPRGEGLRVWAAWNVLLPPLVSLYGYLPARRLGMGEDLPRGVYKDWRRWCSYPNYFFDDPSAADFTGEFEQVEAPVVAVNSVDDRWAPPRSAQALFAHYPNHRLVTVDPSALGVKGIGHLNYVRPKCKALWSDMGNFVRERMELK